MLVAVVSRHVTPGKIYPIQLEPKKLGNRVWGMLRRYSDHAVITYKCDLNFCWTRYVVCKELAHLLIDTDASHYTTDPVSLVQRLIAGLPTQLDAELESEYAAGYGAVELLLPWCLRDHFDYLVQRGDTDLQIAEEFKCPAIYVSMMRGRYGALSRDANQFHV
jgi:hypothetical protein